MADEDRSTILVIDDDPDILRVLRANLELHRFGVVTAGSWAEGQQALAAKRPDLLILDLTLPDGDGIDLCRAVRKENPRLPVIMLTARDTISDKVMGLECGADDYVVKPFETLELLARIRACLRRAMPVAEERITIGELAIDTARRIVTIRGNEAPLTPKEYDLLFLLASRKGAVVSREEIRKEIWKEKEIYSWSRVIDVHIQHLRQKIGDSLTDPEYIITVPGVGYRVKG
ncbi:MAG: response regulator transcription factor [Thermodesulfovibrionales bacterium]